MLIRRIQRRLLAEQRGFTLIELLVGMVMALVVFTATLGLLIASLHKETSAQLRASQLDQAQVAMGRLVRDLRQSTSLTVTNSGSISYTEPTTSGSTSVTFACSSSTSTCTRTVGSTSTKAITNVSNTDIFSPTSGTPTYLSIKLTITATGHNSVTLNDGVDLRTSTIGT